MKLEDIKVGMKVRLLGKHGVSGGIVYDDINDWFEDKEGWGDIEQIKEQGFGYVTEIINDIKIWVGNSIGGNEYCFSSSDLEPWEEESTSIKTPKEWLLTPSVICTTRNGMKFVVVSNSINVTLDSFNTWRYNLNLSYDEKLINVNDYPPSDIMKITYGKETVYERKEENEEYVMEMTIDEIEKELGYKIKIINNK